MMPYTDREASWLARPAASAAPGEPVPEVVKRYGLEAEYRRAEEISALLAGLVDAIGRLVRWLRSPAGTFRRSPL